MDGFLIDTNVISEFVRPDPSLQVKHWFEAADPESLFASVITLGEIRLDIEDLPTSKARRKGISVSMADGLIAATVLDHNLTLVTRNVKDFNGIEVPIFNPWEA